MNEMKIVIHQREGEEEKLDKKEAIEEIASRGENKRKKFELSRVEGVDEEGRE